MAPQRPHVLVTNDDGITSPGLLALKDMLADIGHVTVLAPNHNWSTSGHVKTMHIWAIAHGYISVTPIQLDLTAHDMVDTLHGWDLALW